jgi:glycosyltransferase involved in cell wall biosynthesis
MLGAWSAFANRPENSNAYLYLHTEVSGMANGVRIDRLLERLKAPMDRVRIAPQFELRMGISSNIIADLYRASDVLLATSRGEGFGVPILEAQACGVPAIGTNWTATPELLGAGWLVDGQLEWDEFQGSFWKVPNTDEILAALEASAKLKGDAAGTEEMRARAVAHASAYSTRKVFAENWTPILETLEGELGKANGAPNRAARRAARK